MKYKNTTFTDEARLEFEKVREMLALREKRAFYANKVEYYEDLVEKYKKNAEVKAYYAKEASDYREMQEKCEEELRQLQSKSE